jgi:hypothetical protein
MADTLLHRVPVVAGLAFVERVRQLQSPFTATLLVEPDNRYFPHAIAVLGNGEKLGYIAPEIARRYFDALQARAAAGEPPVTCAGRRGSYADHETSGVELLLDFSALPVAASE